MKRIDTTIETLKEDIGRFYRPDLHHFMVMNAVEMGEKLEIQWFFTEYANSAETVAFCTQIQPDTEVPTIRDIVSSAWVAESELVDLLNVKIERTEKGFVLEPDSEPAPLRKKK